MNNDTETIKIYFDDVSVAEAGMMAKELREDLLDTSPDVQVNIEKEDPTTQDFGTILVAVLSTGAAIAVAKGIADYLRRTRAKIIVKRIRSDGTEDVVYAEELESPDAQKIADAIFSSS